MAKLLQIVVLSLSVLAAVALASAQGNQMQDQMNQMYNQISQQLQKQPSSGPGANSNAMQRARQMLGPMMDRLRQMRQSSQNMPSPPSTSQAQKNFNAQLQRLKSTDLGRQLSARLQGSSSSANNMMSMTQ